MSTGKSKWKIEISKNNTINYLTNRRNLLNKYPVLEIININISQALAIRNQKIIIAPRRMFFLGFIQ